MGEAVYTYIVNDDWVWTINCSQNVSWTWRKILKLRDSFQTYIGRGSSCGLIIGSLWAFDEKIWKLELSI